MLLSRVIDLLSNHGLLVLIFIFTLYHIYNKFGHGVNKYPGPAIAAYTNWWRFFDVLKRRHQHTQIRLHRELGDIVRLGPNVLSFADPQAIKDIYGLNKGFTKTEFYPVQQNVSRGVRIPSLFSTLDEGYHAKLKRKVNSAFAMSTLVSYEPLMDQTTEVFLNRTEELFCKDGALCDFAHWLQMYAFDVIGQLSFSKRLGFIDRFEDVGGIMAALKKFFTYAGTIGQQPWIDRYFWRKNPIKMLLMRYGFISSNSAIAAFALDRSSARRDQLETFKGEQADTDPSSSDNGARGVDFLTRLTAAQESDPEFMNDQRILTIVISLINAGSDTTAISLSSIFYHLLKHPSAYLKLTTELDAAVANGTISPREGLVSWSDAQKLPYMDAVIQESFRLFPAGGLLLERYVPQGGAIICGERFPGGTIVGCNAWVLHRRPEIFGTDVDDFRPERWLEADPERLKAMKGTMFQFGAGPRTCIGRNISVLEIYKLVPSFLRKFEIELVHPDGEWRTENCWFVRQLDFDVHFKLRKDPGKS